MISDGWKITLTLSMIKFYLCTLTNPFHCVQNVYDEFFLSTYNMLYTAAPVVMLGALEQDLTPTTALRYPGLYQPGLQHLWFSRKVFATYAIHGLITSLALIGVTMGKTTKKTSVFAWYVEADNPFIFYHALFISMV